MSKNISVIFNDEGVKTIQQDLSCDSQNVLPILPLIRQTGECKHITDESSLTIKHHSIKNKRLSEKFGTYTLN